MTAFFPNSTDSFPTTFVVLLVFHAPPIRSTKLFDLSRLVSMFYFFRPFGFDAKLALLRAFEIDGSLFSPSVFCFFLVFPHKFFF